VEEVSYTIKEKVLNILLMPIAAVMIPVVACLGIVGFVGNTLARKLREIASGRQVKRTTA